MSLFKLFISEDLQKSNDNKLQDALDVFKWQLISQDNVAKSEVQDANYIICSWNQYNLNYCQFRTKDPSEVRFYIVFENDIEFINVINSIQPLKKYTWDWKLDEATQRFEVTSKGDKRFSPFYMMQISEDERYKGLISLESYYQLFVKGYIDKGYNNPMEVKGLPPLYPEKMPGVFHRMYGDYLFKHKGLFYELAWIGLDHSFTDMFDKDGGQNKIYADLLNKYYGLQ